MNANLRRATFVLTSDQAEALRYVSDRTGASQSAIVRDVLGEPIVQLAEALRSVGSNPDRSQLDLFVGEMADLIETVAADTVASMREGASNDR